MNWEIGTGGSLGVGDLGVVECVAGERVLGQSLVVEWGLGMVQLAVEVVDGSIALVPTS